MTDRDIVGEDIRLILSEHLDWESLSGKTIAITGANGMLAAYLVETLLSLNTFLRIPVRVVALVRNVEKSRKRFARWCGDSNLSFKDWNFESRDLDIQGCNILVHAASIPRPDSRRPADVIGPNVIGTWNLLQYVHNHCRDFEQFVFFSSGAVYGDGIITESRPVEENQYFAVDSMCPESCYAEAKRMGENICVSCMRQYGIPVKILRYAHTYGPGMDLVNDPRSFVYFIRCALAKRPIELRTKGDMARHFCYISDATEAFFRVLIMGRVGEAYNIANDDGCITIRCLAQLVSKIVGGDVFVTMRSFGADEGYAPQRYAFVPDIGKLRGLGFVPKVAPSNGFRRVILHYSKTS